MESEPTTGPRSIDPAAVAQAWIDLRRRITDAGGGPEVSILAVTKTWGPDAIEAARAAGATSIGENYAQELVTKRDACTGLEVHFVGQLQTNKVRMIADIVDVYETVDRPKLAREIARRDPGARIYLQVNTTGEANKGGWPLDDLNTLVDEISGLDLNLEGLMTVGPTIGGPEAARPGFRAVRAAADRLGLVHCSMGMTDDLVVAVEEGTTQVRVGTALFGRRHVPIWRNQGR